MLYNKKLSIKELKEFTDKIDRQDIPGKPEEEFKQLKYNDVYTYYIISSYGRIFSFNYGGTKNKLKEMKPKFTDNYVHITVCVNEKKKDCMIHRLVGFAFISNPDNKKEINHINGKKHDNHVWNLEWCTRKENDTHAWENNLKHPRFGEDVVTSKFTEKQVIKVCKNLSKNKKSLKEIANCTGVDYEMVRAIKDRRAWKHVSCKYDFSNYNNGKSKKQIKEKEKSINKICKMIESNNYTLKEIADMNGISVSMVCKIVKKKSWIEISKNYNIDNYTKK